MQNLNQEIKNQTRVLILNDTVDDDEDDGGGEAVLQRPNRDKK